MSEWKGWEPGWMAAAFSAFAVSRALSSLGIGGLIDRFSAVGLLPFFLLPLGAAVALVRWADQPWMAFPYLMLVGVTAGANANIGSALWAELYGVEHLGRVRATASSLAVLGAASSPALIGALFHYGFDFDHLLLGALGVVVVTSTSALLLALHETQRLDRIGRRLRLLRSFGR